MATSMNLAPRSRSARRCASIRAAITPPTCCAVQSSTSLTTAAISTSSSRPVSLSRDMAGQRPLGDPVAETRRLVAAGTDKGLTGRLLGGAAGRLQAPPQRPGVAGACRDTHIATLPGHPREDTQLPQEGGAARE